MKVLLFFGLAVLASTSAEAMVSTKAACVSACGPRIAWSCAGLSRARTTRCRAKVVRQCQRSGETAVCPAPPAALGPFAGTTWMFDDYGISRQTYRFGAYAGQPSLDGVDQLGHVDVTLAQQTGQYAYAVYDLAGPYGLVTACNVYLFNLVSPTRVEGVKHSYQRDCATPGVGELVGGWDFVGTRVAP